MEHSSIGVEKLPDLFRAISIPRFPSMTDNDVEYVVDTISDFLKK